MCQEAELNGRNQSSCSSRIHDSYDEALTEARSNDEFHRRRTVAEEIRGLDIDDELAAARAHHALHSPAVSPPNIGTAKSIADVEWHTDAVVAQQRATSETAQVAYTHRQSTWISRALIGVMATGVVWGSVNVQHNMTEGALSDPRFWLAFLYDHPSSTSHWLR